MSYQYRVRDPMGKVHEGTLEAASLEEAGQQLRRDGFHVLELEESDAGEPLFPARVSKSEIIYTTSQLAIMVDTGITLAAALSGMVDQEQNPTLRKVLGELKEAVEGGEDFSTALARHPKLFDKTYVSLVRASEATGSLGTMLERIATYLRKELETRGKVRAAMAYPGVMMVLATAVTIFLLTYILPKFTPLFKSKGTQLPKPTVFMMAVSDVILQHWYLWLAGVVALAATYFIGRRTGPGRRFLDWLKISFPIIGPTFRKVTISRSIRTLGTMLSSGVPMLDALKLCGEVAGNYYYEKLWQEVRDQVTAGKRICEVLEGNALFPRVLIQMIACGEETARLDYVLERVSTYYDQEVETAIKTATSMIEPIMISAMGVVVGGIGLALLLPIFSLSKQP
ncbi:MAG: type II secretion system F family protein [Pirellulales bacterium]|nr:type II secretion system F family protein [Pirellulales bacterium]